MAIVHGDGTVTTSGQSFVPKLMMLGSGLLIIIGWVIYYYVIKSASVKLNALLNIESEKSKKALFLSLLIIPLTIKLAYHYFSMPYHDNVLYEILRSMFLVFVSF